MPAFTEDLLSDLKQDLARDAEAERARLAAEQAARLAAEAETARRAEEARRAEMTARLEAENRRRALAHDIRHARIESSLPHSPSAAPPGTAARGAAARGASPTTQGTHARTPLDPVQPTPPAAHRGAGFYFVVMGLPMICLTAVAVVWLLRAPPPAALPAPPPTQLSIGADPMPSPQMPEVAAPGAEVDAPVQPVAAALEAPDPARATSEASAEPPAGRTGRRAARPTSPKPDAAKPDAPKPVRLFGGSSMTDIMGAE